MQCAANRSDVVGIDPAYKNFAIVKLRFTGVRYINNFTEELPIFEPTNMEIWNLRDARGIRNTLSSGGAAETYRIPYALIHPTKITDWLASLNHFLLRANWVFEAYSATEGGPADLLPRVTVENQCDHIKNGRFDMFRIGNACETSIHMRDLCEKGTSFNRLMTRVMGKSARKYGILSDGSLLYAERKGAAIDVTRALFKELNLNGWIDFLDGVLKIGQKIDDLCDALLLALQVAMDEYETKQKNDRKRQPVTDDTALDYTNIDNTTYPKLLSSIRVAQDGTKITEFDLRDISDEDEGAPKKKKKAPSRKRKAEEPTKKKKKETEKTPRVTKKRKTTPK